MFCRANDSAVVVDSITALMDPDKVDPSVAGFGKKESCDFTELWLDRLSVGCDRFDALQPGDLVATRFRIVRRIGSGGQAVTYIAEDLKHRSLDSSEPVTVTDTKYDSTSDQDAELSAQLEGDTTERDCTPPIIVLKEFVLPITGGREVTQEALKRIQQEARLVQSLDHPQIVKCHELVCDGRRAYLVQNLIEGNSLQTIVQNNGPLPEERVIELATSMCDILEYLHGRTPPVVHRDFTPDNLMCNDNCMLTLIDFNVAKELESGYATHTVVGKHSYIPPEQFRGDSCSQSDLYAMGGVLYFLLTGVEPEPIAVACPREKVASVSNGLNDIVSKCTQQQLERRYATAAEVKRALQSLGLTFSQA